MTDSEQDDLCRRCGQPKKKVGSGRLTEWIKVCSCNLTDEALSDKPSEAIELCPTCGKRLTQGRVGSFTQWVFRPDNCNCNNATASGASGVRAKIATPSTVVKSIKYVDDDETKRKQLEEFGDRVPVERYLVVDEIGKGNAGTVFLCRDRLLKKLVAIKSLNFLEPDAYVAFQQEARATSQLNHPNIVTVIDFGATKSAAPYMVLEYFEGVSLEDYLRDNGAVTLDFAIAVLLPICDALSYAHERKLWHRDLKPSNILISDISENNVEAKLIDFGVAAFVQPGESNAASEKQRKTIVGTPAYMSPDQAEGRAYDARCEVYSLGCILFEMLTGRQLFSADTPLELLSMHSKVAPPGVAKLMPQSANYDPELLVQLEKIVKKCLEKRPDVRYQSVSELKQALLSLSEEAESEPVAVTEGQAAVGSHGDSIAPILVLLVVTLCGAWLVSTVWINSLTEPSTSKKSVTEKPVFDINSRTDVLNLNVQNRHWLVVVNTSPLRTLELLKTEGRGLENAWLLSSPSDAILKYLSGLPLQGLAFDGANFTDEQIGMISKFESLKLLVLQQTNLTDQNLEQISMIKQLEGLVVQSPNITNDGLRHLASLQKLNGLSLSGMPQITDQSIDVILTMPELKHLSVARTSVTSGGVTRLIKSGRFRALNLAGVKLTPETFKCLKDSSIERLGFLQSQTVTEEMYKCFTTMKALRVVDLRFCPVVNAQYVDKLNEVRRKKGLRAVSAMIGGEAMTQDWDILISNN